MFEAAVARAKRDQARVFGIGERDARLGDAFEPGGRRVALEHGGGIDDGEISAAREKRRLALADAQHEGCGQQRRELRQSNRGEGTALGGDRLGAETGRLRAERCCRDRRGCGSPLRAIRRRRRSSRRRTIRRAAQDRAPRRAGASEPPAPAPGRSRAAACRFSSVTSSAATARTLISSSRISTGSPRRSAVIASPKGVRLCRRRWTRALCFSLPPLASYGAPRLAPATLFDLTYAAE